MELKIYDKQGLVKMTVRPDNSSQWNHEVGVENVVTVNFTTWEFLVLEVGWYILVEGQRFSIKSEYRPKHIHDTKYTYNLKFYGREHDTQDILFCRLNQGEDDLESVFAYDGTPMDFLQKVVANMNRNTDGVVWKAGEAISANRQTINFNGLYCWDALGEIARAFGTEWWMDGEYLNISKCERGESVSLGYGQGLKSGLTQNENTNAVKWFTRLIPVGSSKNIDKSKYGYDTLQLPGREKYIDINTQYGLKEYREEAAFSEIYPHRVGTISSVRSEAKIDDQGEEYLIYYVKDTELPFNPDNYMLPGEVIHMSFNSGNLAGKEFEVNWNNSTEEFEIINQYPEYVDQLPGGNLIPSSGDQYVLSNISMPDEYNTIAEEAYQSAVDKYIQEYDIDISIYSGVTDYIYISKNNISLSLGNRVNLISKRYFDSGNRGSRITRISRKLNNLSEMTLECSNTISSTWKQTLDSSINNTIVNQQKTQVKTDKNEKDISQISGLWELKKTEDGVEYLYTKFNVLTALGFTSYSIGKEKRFPSIYDGLPIDMNTIYWELDENGKKLYLKAKGGEGNGTFGDIETLGEGNAITKVEIIKGGEADKLVFTKEKTFIDKNYLEENCYTKTYIDKTFITKSGAADLFVTVDDTLQDIDGEKNFIGSLMVNGMPIVYDYRGFWKLEGDLLVTGGIASFSSDTRYTPSTVMDGVVCDERTISADGGYLHFVGEIKGGISNVIPDGNGNAVTSLTLSSDGESVTYYKGMTFAEQQYVEDNFAKKKYVDETFVTLNGDPQTIESQKNFIGGLKVNGNPIVYNAEQGYWKLEGDLLVTGGIASFSDDTAYDPTSIMDAIVCDEQTITVEESNGVKRLKVIGGGTSGGVDEDAVRELIESYKYLDKVATINIYNSVGGSIMSYDGTTNRTLTLSKSHVGLANVEDTALSTWTGNSHISKVGTITSGTWNGSSIGVSYLPTATTSAKGVASFDSSYFSVSSGKVSFTGGGVKIVSSLPSSRTKNTLYVITG